MSQANYCAQCGVVLNQDGTCPDGCLKLSVPEDKMDELVQAASIPNLASLFKAGKAAGLIKPATEYTS